MTEVTAAGFDISSPTKLFLLPPKTIPLKIRQKSYPQPEVTKVK